MADYQEYRRRVLRKRWRRRFMATALLLLLLLVGAIGMLWKSLHREQRPSGVGQNTILQEVTQDNTWNTASYAVARQLTVQTLADSAATALDFRMAALPKSSTAVGKEWFNDVSFVGDSLTQGMQLYEEGMQNAMFCAYKGVGPNVIVNGTTCKRTDGVAEVPLEALTAQQPRAIYVLLGTNVLGRDTDYSSFLTYYRLMLDMLSQTLPNAKIYVQSITPVRPEVCQKSGHEGLNLFQAMGVEVYSVSTDSHFVHKAWHDASESIRKIKYPMLADPTGTLSRAFGVMIEEEGMAYRGTFLVNPEGKIKIAEIQDNNIGRNADELLRKVEAAQFVATHDGEVCPAKWKKGGATLKPSIDLVGKI